jgi:UDP-glucose 4-epimerase
MNKNPAPIKILLIGIYGGLAQLVAKLISNQFPNARILGIDARPLDGISPIPQLKLQKIHYSRAQFETLFREEKFDYVLHLGRLTHASNSGDLLAARLDLSVMGTSRILDLCSRFNVKKVIILSTFHVYGAFADNSIFLEEDAPLKAAIKYPDLRDVVEMDQICTNWMWKNQNSVNTIVLRPCNIIGLKINNAITKYLRSQPLIIPMDFNPAFQFIHEFDMAQVIVHAMDKMPTGTYNVASDDFLLLNEISEHISSQTIKVPLSLISPLNSFLNQYHLSVPAYLLDYLKYSCLISNKLLNQFLPPNFFRFKIKDALGLIK